jgi:hypothetical protein
MKIAIVSLGLLLAAGCGGSEPQPKAPDAEGEPSEEGARHSRSSANIQGEIGALDEERADRVFESAIGALERCLHAGASRVEFLGGQVKFFVKVDSSGSVATYAEESTIGDRQTEKCMLDALRKKDWPKPVGGEVGYARKGFDFDPPNDVRPPTDWPSERASDALRSLESKISECKDGAGGRFSATMYVDTDGKVLSVGVAPPDEAGEAAVDCLVDVLKQSKLPSPGSWPAKVTFTL